VIKLSIIIDWFVPAFKAGGPIQSVKNLADHLQNDFDISIICSNRDLDRSLLGVRTNQWLINDNYKVFYTDKNFKGYRNLIQPFKSVIYINGMFSFQYNLLPLLFLKGRKIVAVRGMLDPGGLSQKSFKKKIYLKCWRLAGLHKKCEYHATSAVEKQNIQSALGIETKVWVIQNLPGVTMYKRLPQKNKNSIILCTMALVSPMKNHLLVLKSLLNCSSEVVYNIYGPIKDEGYWYLCKKIIEQLPSNIKVIYHGFIPSEMVPQALAACHIYIQPSKSENFSHSIYDALMTGRPVITSNYTPWNNLEKECAGVNIEVENIAELTKAIEKFSLIELDQLEQWSKSARSFASKQLCIEQIKKEYLQMFETKNCT